MITLDQPQHIPVETTFKVMEVVKKLEVNGTISGQQLNEFLPNPTLELANEILAACTFQDLIVEGNVVVDKKFNGLSLERVLSDAVYDDGSETVITSPKEFLNLNVQKNANISSNFINDINLNDFMTTEGVQEVNFDRLQGDVRIENLTLSGLFDGVNATQLEIESVRTFGDQFIESPLILINGGRVSASSVDVKATLNDVPINDYFFIDQSIEISLNSRVEVAELTATKSKISNDIVGSGKLQNFNFNDQNRLSKSLKQVINVPVVIQTLTTRNTFGGGTINGVDFEIFRNYMKQIKNFRKSLLSGNHKIENLIVDGNVNLKSINDRNFNEIIQQVIWLNRENSFNEVAFLDEIDIKNNLQIENSINEKNFNNFIKNWVSKNENSIKIDGDVTLEKDVMVEENLIVPEINNIKFEDFLRKQDLMEIEK